ncbi:hypothetical protein [Massilibacterium senegalense]|uniref:hypothetical protein n=1 Tax=Massilibacterium senegalense TaxID=1632858 RepID=UPI0007833B64|nr:hypothetical protein [Massilibacterium senegalense]
MLVDEFTTKRFSKFPLLTTYYELYEISFYPVGDWANYAFVRYMYQKPLLFTIDGCKVGSDSFILSAVIQYKNEIKKRRYK